MFLRIAITIVLTFGSAAAAVAADWPQWRGPNRDTLWDDPAPPKTFPPPGGLKPRWSAAIGWGYSTPVTAGGRVYVTDAEIIDLKSRERIRCFDEATGKPIWSHAYDVEYAKQGFIDRTNSSGPAATPIVQEGRLYTLGKCGHLLCFDAPTGRILWQRALQADYPGPTLNCNASPLIEGDRLIVMLGGKPGACVVAFDCKTGKEAWRALDEGATNSSPIVIAAGGARQLIVWTQESVTSLDPANGKPFWRQRLATSSDYVVSTPVAGPNRLLIGGLMLVLDDAKPAASVLWPKSKSVSRRVLSNTSSPMLDGDAVYSARSSGELVCLDAATGEIRWESDKVTQLASGASIHLTREARGDITWLYTDRGDLIRARLTRTGYEELGRAHLVDPTCQFGSRTCAWSPPAFASGHVLVRSDTQLVSYPLAAEK